MIILDCDNVLADDEWRIRTINWHADSPERYTLYHELSVYDEPANLDLIKPGEKVAIFTAMPERHRSLREDWFARKGIHYNFMLMRGNIDLRPSVEVKRDMLTRLFRLTGLDKSHITAAYDDRPDIIRMYKAHGVNGIHIKIHNTSAYRGSEV